MKARNRYEDKCAIGRCLERHGARLHHPAIRTPDIDHLLNQLREATSATSTGMGAQMHGARKPASITPA